MDMSREFSDYIDEFNKLARAHGCASGRAWACKAERRGIISKSQRIKIENLIDLRNAMDHGNARYVAINGKAINDVKGVIGMMNNVNMSVNRKAAPRLPGGTFRAVQAKPFSKEFTRKGSDGEMYFFRFTIRREEGRGFIVYIEKAPYFEESVPYPHDFHVLNGGGPDPYVCWDRPIESFQDANAVMVVWVRNYVQTLDRFKQEGKIRRRRPAYQKVELPKGTFR